MDCKADSCNNGSSKNIIESEEGQPSEKIPWRRLRWTRLEIFLIICAAVMALALILVVSLDQGRDVHPLCLTGECVKAAATMLDAMNEEVQPCDDFYEYACGKWIEKHVIPDDKSTYSIFTQMTDSLQIDLKDLVESPVTDKDSNTTKKAKYLYQSCLNETLIEDRGLQPIFSLLEELGGWPVLRENSTWEKEKFDLIALMVKLRLYNNAIIFSMFVGGDEKNSDTNIIQLIQPSLGLPSRDYYLAGWENEKIQLYRQFAVDVVVAFGTSKDIAQREMTDMINFEIALANLTTPQEEMRDISKIYKNMTIEDLITDIPEFDWLRYIQNIISAANITVNQSEEIVVFSQNYMKNIVGVMQETSNRTLANYLIWRFVMNRLYNLPKKYRELSQNFEKALTGTLKHPPRWKICVGYVNVMMPSPIGRMYVEKHFKDEDKEIAMDMIEHLRVTFADILGQVDWMDSKTLKVAREKANAMGTKIGYPEIIMNDTAVEKAYKELDVHPDTYFENVLEALRVTVVDGLEILTEPVDKTLWSGGPANINAWYHFLKNDITFPAGILQPPFFSASYPKYLNYGGIGAVIGHEMTHGFDDQGRMFDKDGNLKQWWDNYVIEKFKNDAQCFIDQYSNFTIPDINLNLNGVLTQGENIADNGGLKEAYKAYVKWLDEQTEEEPRLPGLDHLSHKQLFYLKFAQTWCEKVRPEYAMTRAKISYHCPARFRVIGSVQNSFEFSKAFNCPKGSKMNPEKKCQLW